MNQPVRFQSRTKGKANCYKEKRRTKHGKRQSETDNNDKGKRKQNKGSTVWAREVGNRRESALKRAKLSNEPSLEEFLEMKELFKSEKTKK